MVPYLFGEVILNLTEAPGKTTPSSIRIKGSFEGIFCILKNFSKFTKLCHYTSFTTLVSCYVRTNGTCQIVLENFFFFFTDGEVYYPKTIVQSLNSIRLVSEVSLSELTLWNLLLKMNQFWYRPKDLKQCNLAFSLAVDIIMRQAKYKMENS